MLQTVQPARLLCEHRELNDESSAAPFEYSVSTLQKTEDKSTSIAAPTCEGIAAREGVSLRRRGAKGIAREGRLGAEDAQERLGDEAGAARLRGRHDPAV